MPRPSFLRDPPLLLLVVLVALPVLLVYGQAVTFRFVNQDDLKYLVENPHVAGGLSWESLRWAFTTDADAGRIPLTWISRLLDVTLFGLDPAGHHGVNVLLHLGGALLLLHAFRRMTGRPWESLVAALLFAVHPQHVESVAWVTERKDVLCGLFWMLSLVLYARYAERPGAGRFALVLLSFALSLLSKPMAVTLPFVLLLLDFWPLGRLRRGAAAGEGSSGRGSPCDEPARLRFTSLRPPPAAAPPVLPPSPGWIGRAGGAGGAGGAEDAPPSFPPSTAGRLLLEKVPLLALSAAVVAATWISEGDAGAIQPLGELPLAPRAANAALAYAAYLGKGLWPSGLAVIYPHPWPDVPYGRAAAAALLLAAATALAVRERWRRPWVPVGWLWFLGTLVPVIGLVQVGAFARADRYAYLPMVGIYAAVAFGGGEAVRRLAVPGRAVAAVVTAWIVVLAAAAHVQAGYWKDSETLLRRTVAVTGDNPVARFDLGLAYLEQERPAEALPHLRDALRLRPSYEREIRLIAGALRDAGYGAEAEALSSLLPPVDPPPAPAGREEVRTPRSRE